MDNFIKENNIKIFDILDSVNLAIWIIEYSEEKNIHKFYGNKTLYRIMGIKNKKEMSTTDVFYYWYNHIDKKYLDNVNAVLRNMIYAFEKKSLDLKTDEVCYIWKHDIKGNRNIRCGGHVIECKDGIYKICGYHQDYTDIVMIKDWMKREEKSLKEKIESVNYLKQYYQELAYIDELTKVVNRRGFYEEIDYIMEHRMKRENDHLWISIVDLDFFKKVNDTYGHLNGDKVLKKMGELLLDLSNSNQDIFTFRYGGEEFIILIYQHSKEEVRQIIENFRIKLEQEVINIDKNLTINITCSIGIANVKMNKLLNNEECRNEGIMRADKALYQAKKTGRNKVVFDGE